MPQEEFPFRHQPDFTDDVFRDLSESQIAAVRRRIAYVYALEALPPWKRSASDVEATLAAVADAVGDALPAMLPTVKAWRRRYCDGGRHPLSLVDLRSVRPSCLTDHSKDWVDRVLDGLADLYLAPGRLSVAHLAAYAENRCLKAAAVEGRCSTEVPSRNTLRRKIGARVRSGDPRRYQVRRPIAAYPLAEVWVHRVALHIPLLGLAHVLIGVDAYSGVIVAAMIDISAQGEEALASFIDSFGAQVPTGGWHHRIVVRACLGLPGTLALDPGREGMSPNIQQCAARRGITLMSLPAHHSASAGPLADIERWVATALPTTPDETVTAIETWLVRHDNGRSHWTAMTRRERWTEGVEQHGIRVPSGIPHAVDPGDAEPEGDQGPGSH